eukprot:TRINITY_DN8692_c0_g1_i1.p1 TRINITY_DN8692_c0_g1~~TRINITY_DN8692_c0_g1_i1.p1  ORF type:complete len:118 (+),score=18.04 TRINITY_DN8692_c0_g1_i1:27-356(+)
MATKAILGRAQRGLYAGRRVLTGNTISFSHKRNRRRWLPNVHGKWLRSDLLEEDLYIKITVGALRQIDRLGGLDNYLLFTKPEKIDSEYGMQVREEIIGKWEEKKQQEV